MNFRIVFIIIFTVHATIIQADLLSRDNQDQANNFKSCTANQIYPINLTGVYFEPNPIIVGVKQYTRLVGSFSTTIQQGAFASLLLSYDGKPITDYQFKICSFLGQNCPIKPNYFDFVISSVPSIKPAYAANSTISFNTTLSGENYLFHFFIIQKNWAIIELKNFIVQNADNSTLMCLEGPINFYFPNTNH
jgi:hypothetical protein